MAFLPELVEGSGRDREYSSNLESFARGGFMEDKLAEAVRLQYEAYSYPAPLDDVSKDRLAADPSAASVLWPCGRFNDDLRILSVGCGTHQAAMIAFRNPGCSVVGIDLSSASLKVSRLGGTQAE